MLSIIVPVYKTKQYLNKCVSSLVAQTYRDTEIILVDDGSPDECGEMCDEWAKKDARIRVVHRENGGLSAARNSGLEVAKGEYIAFIDSDDYTDENMFLMLMNAVEANNADIAECAYIKVGESEKEQAQARNDAEKSEAVLCFNSEQAMEELICERNVHQVVWNKVYSKKALEGLIFREGKLNEDEFFTYRAVGNSKRVVSLKAQLYFYVQHENSIMSSGYSVRRLDAVEALKERMDYVEEKFPKLYNLAKASYLGSCMYAHQCLARNASVDSDKTHRNKLVKRVREEKADNSVIFLMGGKTPLFFVLFRIFPNFTSALRNRLGVGL
ncbi:MAG: glycosyltransferase [Clostridia bacterium]|nr:glycosyltransferase [Clostridia bacterium]